MIKKIFAFTIVMLSLTLSLAIYRKTSRFAPVTSFPDRIIDLKEPDSVVVPTYAKLISEINTKNNAIQSFYCKNFHIQLWEGGHRYRLTGSVAYLKPKNFRMKIESFFGKELDLGSNDKHFWYWSRRDKKPGVYWAAYEDFGKTRLKTPFDPMLMRASIGIEPLELENATVTDSPSDLMLTYERQNSTGNAIRFSVFVNKKRKQIDGFIITDLAGKTLVSCEILNHVGDLPQKVAYNWHEENRAMTISFEEPIANSVISPASFVVPAYDVKINMAEE